VLRSGPGSEFYATDRLAAGTQIEVYREEKDGWLAVRPPPDSFSLVERRQLKAGDEPGVAVVITEDVLSCVGSRVETVPAYVSQVRLRKDEAVELLDPWDEAAVVESGDRAWCRIAPPAGEFRWVQANALKQDASSQPDASVRSKVATDAGTAETPGPASTPKTSFEADGWRTRPADVAATPPRPTAPAVPAADPQTAPATNAKQASPIAEANQGWTATPAISATPKSDETRQVDTANASPKVPPKKTIPSQIRVPVDGENLTGRLASNSLAATGTNPRQSALETPETPISLVSEPLSPAPATAVPVVPAPTVDRWTSRTPPPRQSIDELEVDLAMMVAQDARTWRLAELRQRVDANLIRFETTAERVQARRLLERIGEFEQLQSRMAQASPQTIPPVPTTASSPPAAASAPAETAPAETASTAAADVKYDGSGWLVPVHSATGAAPPFALLDAQGEVLGYVSPTPGLNLQRYVRKQVGIFGLRGYVSTLNKPHVTAERVVDLDRHLR
jgi:hypothetical protein